MVFVEGARELWKNLKNLRKPKVAEITQVQALQAYKTRMYRSGIPMDASGEAEVAGPGRMPEPEGKTKN